MFMMMIRKSVESQSLLSEEEGRTLGVYEQIYLNQHFIATEWKDYD
jgi:hypothetical protein